MLCQSYENCELDGFVGLPNSQNPANAMTKENRSETRDTPLTLMKWSKAQKKGIERPTSIEKIVINMKKRYNHKDPRSHRFATAVATDTCSLSRETTAAMNTQGPVSSIALSR